MVSYQDDSSLEGKRDVDIATKAFPVAIIGETGLFQKTGKKTFEEDSLNNYKPIEGYEGLHRFDPDFEWEPAEEKRLVRKVNRPCTSIQIVHC